MEQTEKYSIKLESFEGPFDLLLELLEKNKIEIMDIKISEIADQYLDFLFSAEDFNMEVATEFLVMASTLIHMKSKKLLPKPEEEEEEEMTEEELKRRLVMYKRFKGAAVLLKEQMAKWEGAMYSDGENLSFKPREVFIELNPVQLVNSYTKAYARYIESKNESVKDKMKTILRVEKVSLKEKIREVISSVRKRTRMFFSELFNLKKNTRMEVVTGFLAVLELDRIRQVSVKQEKTYGDIEVKYNENGDGEGNELLTELEDDYE